MKTVLFKRLLLQSSISHDDADDALSVEVEGSSQEFDAEREETDNTRPLRIAAIFIILASAMLGGLFPLFLKVGPQQIHIRTRCIRRK